MNMKSTIVHCLEEWGYEVNDDGGGILLDDGISIDIIKPQRYVTIDIPVFSIDTDDENMAELLRKTSNALNDGYVWHTHFFYDEQW